MKIKNISSSHPLQPLANGAYDEHDWALFELSTDLFGINEIRDLTDETKHTFIGSYRRIMLDNVHLYVVTRRGLLNAYSIAGSSTSVNFFGSKVPQNVWTIQLDKPLGK